MDGRLVIAQCLTAGGAFLGHRAPHQVVALPHLLSVNPNCSSRAVAHRHSSMHPERQACERGWHRPALLWPTLRTLTVYLPYTVDGAEFV